MQWKKETVFLLGGLFGKTAALPTAASLQRPLKECSPLLSLNPSIPPNELLPLISRNTSPASPRPPPSNHTAASCGQGYAQVHGKCSIKEPSVHPHTLKTVHSGNFNLAAFFACLYHLFNLTAWPSSSKNLWLCLLSQGCGCHPFLRRILTAHVAEIFLVYKNRSQFGIGGYKLLNSCPFTPKVYRSIH